MEANQEPSLMESVRTMLSAVNIAFLTLLTLSPSGGAARAQNKVGEIINDQGVVTQGQVGNNFIIQQMPPSIEMGEGLPTVKNQDGTYTLQSIFRLRAMSPSNALVVSVRKEDVAPPQGNTLGILNSFGFSQNGAGTTAGSFGSTEEHYFQKVQTPAAGEYIVHAKVTSLEAQPRLVFQLE
jgi:hypothetical protein